MQSLFDDGGAIIGTQGRLTFVPSEAAKPAERPAKRRKQSLSRQHRQFPLLLSVCSARDALGNRLNVWLYGPAGTGKTTAAAAVADKLGLPFFFNGAIDSEHKLLGFTDALGRIVSRPFRHAYENGGVYLFDEVEASLPGALLAFNAALANGHCDFPDGSIKRHRDCIIIAAGNTCGGGGTTDYAARVRQDAAFLDRFVFLEWPIDEALELELAGPDGADWARSVQRWRANAKALGVKVIISPRATINGAGLLRSGIDRDTVIGLTVRKGMSDADWAKVNG